MLSRLRIRGKLALLLSIPLLASIGLAVPVVTDQMELANRTARTVEAVQVASQVGDLMREVRRERLLSIAYLLNLVDREKLLQQSSAVNAQVTALRTNLGPDRPAEVNTALNEVQSLVVLRVAILARTATPPQVFTGYRQVTNTLLDSLRLTLDVDTTTPAGRQVLALDAVLRADERITEAATLILLVAANKDPQASREYVAAMALLEGDRSRFHTFATPEQIKLYRQVEESGTAWLSREVLHRGDLDPARTVQGTTAAALLPSVESLIELGQLVEQKTTADALDEVNAQQWQARLTAYTVAGFAGALIVIMILLSLAVVRSIAQPLARLTRLAERVSRIAEAELLRISDDEAEPMEQVRLKPVDIDTSDEIGDLARAINHAQAKAGHLVEQQAASRRNVAQMFGHVGRRTHNLVSRQLALIDQLEQQEADPQRLQQLYRLDHISSRLRRNASSLVVLSGSPCTDGHLAPLPLANVIRLALGEIEDFVRVDVTAPVGVAVAPAAVGDLALTLAELMENATTHSPPHTRVTVTATLIECGLHLRIVDQGIGMSPEKLAEANARMTQREGLGLAPTETLGLFVVGRLARRHDWRVVLSPASGGGITVDLEISKRLLVTGRVEPYPIALAQTETASVTPAPAVRAPDEAPPAWPPRRRLALAAAAEPARPVPVSGPPLQVGSADTFTEQVYDVALVNQVSQRAKSVPSWNAFAPRVAAPGSRAGRLTRLPTRSEPLQNNLTQRVPGASLEPILTARSHLRPVVPPPSDAEEVRQLITQFESGVARALSESCSEHHNDEESSR